MENEEDDKAELALLCSLLTGTFGADTGGGGCAVDCAAFAVVVLTLPAATTLSLVVEDEDEEDPIAAWRFATRTDFNPLVGRPRLFNSTRSFATVSLVGSTMFVLSGFNILIYCVYVIYCSATVELL